MPARRTPADRLAELNPRNGDEPASRARARAKRTSDDGAAKRSYGSGSLSIRTDRNGREAWYGQWRVRGRRVTRRLGLKRPPGTKEGLTRAQAEQRLRQAIESDATAPPPERMTVAGAGARHLAHLEALGRKRSTLMDYESYLRVHLAPFFGDLPLDRIERDDVEDFIAEKKASGLATKSVLNYLGLLHAIFEHAQRRGWARANPCKQVDKPPAGEGDPDIRFLDDAELEALLRAVPEEGIGLTDRALYLAAAMSGLRQGELVALRWRDVDWPARRIRVRQNYVRGEYGTPKSRRSTRSVPLADRLAAELDRHHQRSAYQSDDDLAFCHPETGGPLERSRLLKRFKDYLRKAGVREVRFHDLRHTFGTRMAAAGIALRTLQEWMGHRDFKTTLIYADYQPSEHEAELVERAFGRPAPAIRAATKRN